MQSATSDAINTSVTIKTSAKKLPSAQLADNLDDRHKKKKPSTRWKKSKKSAAKSVTRSAAKTGKMADATANKQANNKAGKKPVRKTGKPAKARASKKAVKKARNPVRDVLMQLVTGSESDAIRVAAARVLLSQGGVLLSEEDARHPAIHDQENERDELLSDVRMLVEELRNGVTIR